MPFFEKSNRKKRETGQKVRRGTLIAKPGPSNGLTRPAARLTWKSPARTGGAQ